MNAVIWKVLACCLVVWGTPVTQGWAGDLKMTGCFDIWPPYTDPDGGGITPGLVAAVADQAGLSVSLVQMPWKRCLAAVGQGNITFALDAMPRPGYLSSALPVTRIRTGVFALLGRFSDLSDLSKLREVLVGRPLGWSNWEMVMDRMPAGPVYTLIEAGEPGQMLDMLRHDRIDIYVDDVKSVHLLAVQHQLRLTTLMIPPGGRDLYILFGPQRDHEKDIWDAAMDQFQASGRLQEHFRRNGMVP